MTATDDLWAGVDRLLNPTRHRLHRDGSDKPTWTTIPALWDQLAAATAVGAEQTGSSQFGSRLPVAVDVLELRTTIADVLADALAAHRVDRRPDVPGNVRLLAAHIAATRDDDLTGWWAYRLHSWCRQIANTLGQAGPQPRRLRGSLCPDCGASHALIDGQEGAERVPALLVDFVDGRVRAVTCSVCGAVWWRGDDLWRLSDQIAAAANTPQPGDAA